MIIERKDDCIEYICSLCGHKHIEYADGRKENDPFILKKDKLKVIKTTDELIKTNTGKRRNSIVFEFDGYTCPKCNKLQIDVIDYNNKFNN